MTRPSRNQHEYLRSKLISFAKNLSSDEVNKQPFQNSALKPDLHPADWEFGNVGLDIFMACQPKISKCISITCTAPNAGDKIYILIP